ncbi:MAG: ferritin family protein [Candidatus Altiarchaeota archaeon]|nr:ferritin family protein [Candidatus Altiarchaeota archaeon]
MELKEALKTALDFEQKGQKIYEKAAKKTLNPIVKRTFTYLAGQEVNHIREIKEFMKKEVPDVKLEGDRIEDVRKFFTMTTKEFKEKTRLSDDDIKAHETALALEKSSYDFYEIRLSQSMDDMTKKFFRFLMDQEEAHYELVQKAYHFIKDPTAFYSEEEGWIAEGG